MALLRRQSLLRELSPPCAGGGGGGGGRKSGGGREVGMEEGRRIPELVLMTTFDPVSGTVPEQEIAVSVIIEQVLPKP